MTQAERLQRLLEDRPGSSSLEITLATGIVNVTGRVSDLRLHGIAVRAYKDREGTWRYRLPDPELTLGLVS